MRKSYPVEVSDKISGKIYYPADFKISEPILSVTFGTKSAPVTCNVHPEGKNRIVISNDISKQLYFPNFHIPLHLFLHNQTLYIGPLIGIFTTGFTPIQIRPLGKRSYFFSKLLSMQKSVGVLPFLFGEEHIDWEKGLISGYFFINNTWERRNIPFPYVIYDRLPNRHTENQSVFKKVKETLQSDYLIPWYNLGFFNKLDVYERLKKVANVNKYLPITQPFNVSIVAEMLTKHRRVYIKPENGSHGLEIYQITYDRIKNDYYCRYFDEQKNYRLQRFKNLETLFQRVLATKNTKKMLVQQGIQLLRIENKQVDFRIHANKDKNGEWIVSAIAAKVAQPQSVTTHIKDGGEIQTLAEIFPDYQIKKKYEDKLISAALSLSKALDQQMNGIIGEIGFDLGIDTNDRVWLFEANSKPGRSIFLHPNLTSADRLTRKLTLDYSIFLTEKVIKKPEEVMKA